MSEVPKSCQTCPIVEQCQGIIKALEKKEDQTIMAMMGDALDNQVEQLRSMGMPIFLPIDDGSGASEVELTPELAREMASREVEALHTSINIYKEVLERATTMCIGTLALHASADGMEYEVTVCRSPENDNHYLQDPDYLVSNEKRTEVDEVKVQVARIHRRTIKPQEPDAS